MLKILCILVGKEFILVERKFISAGKILMARKIFEFCSFSDACRVYFRGQNTIKTCNIKTLP